MDTTDNKTWLGTALVHLPLAFFAVSLFLPAIRITVFNATTIEGYVALYWSFAGVVEGIQTVSTQDDAYSLLAFLMGAAANIQFAAAYLLMAAHRHFGRGASYTSCKRIAVLTVLLMLLVTVPLYLADDTFAPRIGYFLWLAAAVAQLVAAQRLA